MIRAVKQGEKWYGLEIELNDDEVENISIFVAEDGPVILAASKGEIEELVGQEIEMVE